MRREVRQDLIVELRKHNATKVLRQVPYIGPMLAAQLIALMLTPHKFRAKRQPTAGWN